MLEIALDHFLNLVTWLVILGGTFFILATLVGSSRRAKDKQRVEIEDMSRELDEDQFEFRQVMGDLSESSSFKYKVKKDGGHLFVLTFKGSIDADEVNVLRHEITAVLSVADKEKDEILLCLESGGGVVHGYGLVASQVERIKKAGIKVTCSVDTVAASGGYMAACVADRIVAAPFACIGSIGVVASLPNFAELLEKAGIEFKEYTAGESKRLVSQYREITEEQEAEFKKELETTHESFIKHVMKHRSFEERPNDVFTGKTWIAEDALEIGLVDEIMTSDEFISDFHASKDTGTVFSVSTFIPKDPSRYLDKFLRVVVNRVRSATQKKEFL